jgi:hypothetical protein
MNEMKALFQQLISPEQKQLSELVARKGGVKALRGNERAFIELEMAVSNASGQPGTEGLRVRQKKLGDADPEIDNLRNEILEDPNAAADNNWKVFSRKFDAQRNQIIDKLTLVVQRESDRVIRGVQGSAHERIRDQVSFFQLPLCSTYNYHLVFSVVNSRDLGRNGRYDAIPSVECLNPITLLGLARACEGSTLCSGPSGLLP